MKNLSSLNLKLAVHIKMLFLLILLSSVAFSTEIPTVDNAGRAGDIDPTFYGSAYNQPEGNVQRTIRQPDGKIIVAGSFEVINGKLHEDIVRLNADGTIDSTFTAQKHFSFITSLGMQSDGKILVAGIRVPTFGFMKSLIRLNTDGTLDTTFSFFALESSRTIHDLVVLPNDKILIGGGLFMNVNGVNAANLVRLNSNGTIDNTFQPINEVDVVRDIELQLDGKILGPITDFVSNNRIIKRFNADGTLDSTFTAMADGTLATVKMQPDGKILLGGSFSKVNNFSAQKIARVNSDGTSDPSFAAMASDVVNKIEIGTNGKILAGGIFTKVNGLARNRVVSLNNDGSVNLEFDPHSSTAITETKAFEITNILVLPEGKIFIGGRGIRFNIGALVMKLNSDGSKDEFFNVLIGNRALIREIVRQEDGKLLIAGIFGGVGSVTRPNMARLNEDGTFDNTFIPFFTQTGVTVNSPVHAITIQPNKKILVGGINLLTRLNEDGTFDNSFGGVLPITGPIWDIVLLPDGKILVAGNFSVLGDDSTRTLARFNQDGTLDLFQPIIPNNTVFKILFQPDGKMLLCGDFTSIGSTTRNRIARLNVDGSVDVTFNALGGSNNYIYDLGLQSNGKVVVGGSFTSFNGTTKSYLVRLNADGTMDSTFAATVNSHIFGIKVQSDDKVLIGGQFTSVNGMSSGGLTRLNSDGTTDFSLKVGAGVNVSVNNFVNGSVNKFEILPDNKILVGGSFTRYKNTPAVSIFRLSNSKSQRQNSFDFDGDDKADVSVFRPSNGVWYINQSTSGLSGIAFGVATDKIVPADYDGDGRTDAAVFRNGTWYLNRSQLGFTGVSFGEATDIPVPADYDGDGKADIAVFRPSNATWYLLNSTTGFTAVTFGVGTDKPVPADYDGDGKANIAVFRPSNGTWYTSQNPATNYGAIVFGEANDKLVPADYDGDGKADAAVFRPSNGSWFMQRSRDGFTGVQFGISTDLPAPADYDGDGKADVAVFRSGTWFINRSTSGFTGVSFGTSSDKPVPNAFVP
jgi:uncharacterized delta-60 repeat protein